MTVHFRRTSLSPTEEWGAVAVSLLAGAGAALVSYYVTRLFLSREPIGPDAPPDPGEGSEIPSLPRGARSSGPEH